MTGEPKKILVIGGAGYLGSVLTRQLLDSGYAVRVLDSFRFGQDSLDEIKSNPNLHVVDGDILNIAQVTQALEGVDGVVLLAALVGEPACDANPKETVDINYFGPKVVAEACRYYGIDRFILASTDSIYGIREGIMREDSEKNPISLYATLKLKLENEIVALQADQFSPVVLRMCTLYGFSPRMRFDLVVNVLAMHASVNGRIQVHGGKQWRPFVHVADAARAYQLVLEAPTDVVAGEIFNVGSNEQNYQIGNIADSILRVFPDVQIETIPVSPDLRDYYVNCDKISGSLGFKADRSIVDGICEIRDVLNSDEIENPLEQRYYNVKHQ